MKKSLMTSFMIITVFNALDRTLGFFFRIYLSREMGAENMGVYQVASSVFLALLTFITSGVPLVVSKRVAKATRCGDEKKASAVTNAALFIGVITGCVLTALTLSFYPVLRTIMGAEAAFSLVLLSPRLFFRRCTALFAAICGESRSFSSWRSSR